MKQNCSLVLEILHFEVQIVSQQRVRGPNFIIERILKNVTSQKLNNNGGIGYHLGYGLSE